MVSTHCGSTNHTLWITQQGSTNLTYLDKLEGQTNNKVAPPVDLDRNRHGRWAGTLGPQLGDNHKRDRSWQNTKWINQLDIGITSLVWNLMQHEFLPVATQISSIATQY